MRWVIAAVGLCWIAVAAEAATFTVSNNADLGPGSLRQAITDANATLGLDSIDFSIGTGPQTIPVASTLTVTSPLIIDGSTQEGFSGTPLIFLNGSGTPVDGIVFAAGADGSAFRHLEIGGFLGTFDTASIAITGANNVVVTGNYLGGINSVLRRSRAGVRIETDDNTIGGLTAADRNVCVNESRDVLITETASGNVVQGNYMGLDPTGLVQTFPSTLGVFIRGGSANVIGGTQPGARNVMLTSGNCIQLTNGAQDNRIEGNYLGLGANGLPVGPHFPGVSGVTVTSGAGPGNVIGGTTAAARNVISNHENGVVGDAAGTAIQGNFIGTTATGLAAAGNDIGVIVAAPAGCVIGGTAPGAGNLISGNTQYGVFVSATGTTVQGNSIGTDVTGLAALPNGISGVHLTNIAALVGSGSAAGRNVISGNTGDGIEGDAVQFTAGDAITGNYIGVGADGVTPVPNGGNGVNLTANFGLPPAITSNVIARNALAGVRLTDATGVVIGGSALTANTIANNGADGVAVTGLSMGNTIRFNSIDVNGGLGIDLADNGVTLNDPLDADSGPNALQNFPTLTRAITGAGQTVVTGTLSSSPSTSFTIDVYASAAADPTGFGEGARHLGSTVVVTAPDGQAPFAATVAATSAAEVISATATAAASGTSEFADAILAEPAGTLQFSSATYVSQEGNTVTITVTRTGGSAGTVTVDYTVGGGTATAGVDYVATNGTLTFLDGQTSATFTIDVTADPTSEGNETVQLTLSNPTGGASLGTPSQATLTITEPVPIPTLNELAAFLLAALLAMLAMRSLRLS
jgi:hypothetical protein